jgi:hypothetical protein
MKLGISPQRENPKVRTLENKAPRKIFGLKKEDITGEFTQGISSVLTTLYC